MSKYPFGKPLDPSDLGKMTAKLRVDKEKKIVFIEFETPIDWFVLSKYSLKLFVHELSTALQEFD